MVSFVYSLPETSLGGTGRHRAGENRKRNREKQGSDERWPASPGKSGQVVASYITRHDGASEMGPFIAHVHQRRRFLQENDDVDVRTHEFDSVARL